MLNAKIFSANCLVSNATFSFLAKLERFVEMTCAHTIAVFNKFSKQKLVQLFLNTEASKIFAMSSEFKDLLGYFKKLEADVAILKNVNEKFLQRIMDNKFLEMVGIHASIGDTTLEDKVCQVFRAIRVEVGEGYHRVKKDKSRTIVKFSNRKDSLEILQKKKRLRDTEPAVEHKIMKSFF